MNAMPAPEELRVKPFLKWAGGKSWLLPKLLPLIGRPNGTYFEPFLGAGAAFLAIDSQVSKRGSDTNAELITTWVQVRDNLSGVISVLETFQNSEHAYRQVRSWDRGVDGLANRSDAERAARMIFLNKTCFNGLYRVNSRGEFNVPWGRNPRAKFLDAPTLSAVSGRLRGDSRISPKPELSLESYISAVSRASTGDVVYFDPPYEPLNATSSFVSYQKSGFSKGDQEALRDVAKAAMSRGARVIISNSSAPLIDGLYTPGLGFEKIHVSSSRAISASAKGRGKVLEYLIIGEPK